MLSPFVSNPSSRESEARWAAIIEAAVDGIVVIDARGRIEAFNPAAERLFGYSEADVLGRNVSMLMPSPYAEEHDGYLERYITTGTAKVIGIGREVTGRRSDGSTFPLHLSVGAMEFAGQRKFTGILHDLSERVAMEAQLREQTSLARLGEMAAVIAHEVKNPLAGIRGAIQVLSGRLAGTPEAEVMGAVISRIDTLNDLVKDLLLYARPPQPKVLPVDVGHVLMNTARLVAADPALNHVAIVIEGSAAPVQGDSELLNIVFLNLMLNGAHAVGGEGRIVVRVQDAGDLCRIVIADSGPGIPPEIREKIFTPFFTTKARGTGLGLPTVKRLIDAHRGRITIDCPPGGGTHVAIDLPRTWSHS